MDEFKRKFMDVSHELACTVAETCTEFKMTSRGQKNRRF